MMTKAKLLASLALGGVLIHSQDVLAQEFPASEGLAADSELAIDAERERLESVVQGYRDALSEFNGLYNQDSREILLALGDTLVQLGRFDEASFAYGEALQSIRINEGLFSDRQLLVIESLISAELQAGNWSEVDNKLFLAMSLANTRLEVNDPRYEKWVRQFASWKIQAYLNDARVSDDKRAIEDSIGGYQSLINGLSEDDPDYRSKLIGFTFEKGVAHYYSAMTIAEMEYDDFDTRGTETMNVTTCRKVTESSSNGPRTVTICRDDQVPNPDYFESRQEAKFDALQEHITAIRQSHQQLIEDLEADPETTIEELVTAVLDFGDLNYLLEDVVRAKTQYARAFEIISSDESAMQLEQLLMGQPKRIARKLIAGMERVNFNGRPSGLVSFEVTADGAIRNMGITGSGRDLEQGNLEHITNILRRSVYRPRIIEGVTADGQLQIDAAQL